MIRQFFESRAPLPIFVFLFFLSWVFFIINCFGYKVLDDFFQSNSFLFVFHYVLSSLYLFLNVPVYYLMYVFSWTGFDLIFFKIIFFIIAIVAQSYGVILMKQQVEEPEGVRYFVAFILVGLMFVCFLAINCVELVNHLGAP